ncbi:MAG: choice-of-anchor D domain-containing protein [Candidatus Viridilinea halotolerans]|uniref:Choice-of-anchor D domain-containing protein n=1 Tax=Candidatus Viridilinea halotolerans TaxID=2491704 RepID=A0A426TVE6_9CHLR|nr:MAG: choice-of-anchor D domain-containing protein [Candidatus Viridilinea halotolerans]
MGSATFSVVAATPGYASTPAPGNTINLGSVQVGSSVTTTLTISETGNMTLTLSNPQISGAGASHFRLASSPSFPLSIPDGGASATLLVTCAPTTTGTLSATLTMATNDPAQASASYPLTCTGLAADDGRMRVFLPLVRR